MPPKKPTPAKVLEVLGGQLVEDKIKREREKVRLVVLAAMASGRSLLADKPILKAITPAERKLFKSLSKLDQQLFEDVMRGGKELRQKAGMALTVDMDTSAILALESEPRGK